MNDQNVVTIPNLSNDHIVASPAMQITVVHCRTDVACHVDLINDNLQWTPAMGNNAGEARM